MEGESEEYHDDGGDFEEAEAESPEADDGGFDAGLEVNQDFQNANFGQAPEPEAGPGGRPQSAKVNLVQPRFQYPAQASFQQPSKQRPMSAAQDKGRNLAQNSRLPTESSNIDITKLRPKKVRGEKESLWEQAQMHKVQVNNYKSENTKLKTRIRQLERELTEKDDIVHDLFNQKDVSAIGSLGTKINK